MLYVPAPAVENIRIVTIVDQPMWDGVDDNKSSVNYGKPKPLMQNYQDFLLGRLADETFIEFGGKKEGLDYIEVLQLARHQIKATRGVVGYHSFDDEVVRRLRQSILKPKAGTLGKPEFEHNWIEWVLLWKAEPKSEPPAVLALVEPEPSNG